MDRSVRGSFVKLHFDQSGAAKAEKGSALAWGADDRADVTRNGWELSRFDLSRNQGRNYLSIMRERKLWTDEEVAKLRKLRAAGASPARVAVALNKRTDRIKAKARELGISFQAQREVRKQQRDKERAARTKAGLPADLDPSMPRR